MLSTQQTVVQTDLISCTNALSCDPECSLLGLIDALCVRAEKTQSTAASSRSAASGLTAEECASVLRRQASVGILRAYIHTHTHRRQCSDARDARRSGYAV